MQFSSFFIVNIVAIFCNVYNGWCFTFKLFLLSFCSVSALLFFCFQGKRIFSFSWLICSINSLLLDIEYKDVKKIDEFFELKVSKLKHCADLVCHIEKNYFKTKFIRRKRPLFCNLFKEKPSSETYSASWSSSFIELLCALFCNTMCMFMWNAFVTSITPLILASKVGAFR